MKKHDKSAVKADDKLKDPATPEHECKVVNLKERYESIQLKKFIAFILNNSKSF